METWNKTNLTLNVGKILGISTGTKNLNHHGKAYVSNSPPISSSWSFITAIPALSELIALFLELLMMGIQKLCRMNSQLFLVFPSNIIKVLFVSHIIRILEELQWPPSYSITKKIIELYGRRNNSHPKFSWFRIHSWFWSIRPSSTPPLLAEAKPQTILVLIIDRAIDNASYRSDFSPLKFISSISQTFLCKFSKPLWSTIIMSTGSPWDSL